MVESGVARTVWKIKIPSFSLLDVPHQVPNVPRLDELRGFLAHGQGLEVDLPHLILAISFSRRSSVNKLAFVSTTKYSRSAPSISTSTAQSGLYVPSGVGTLNQPGSLA